MFNWPCWVGWIGMLRHGTNRNQIPIINFSECHVIKVKPLSNERDLSSLSQHPQKTFCESL